MATLSELKFDYPYGAERVMGALQDMHGRQVITLEDAAVVSWPPGNKKPMMPKQGAGSAALLWSSLEEEGIDEEFIKRVSEKVTEGISALFALTSVAKLAEVADELKAYDFEVISTNLPEEQEQKLREAFAQEQ
jgi:uncharacterized membrane protein